MQQKDFNRTLLSEFMGDKGLDRCGESEIVIDDKISSAWHYDYRYIITDLYIDRYLELCEMSRLELEERRASGLLYYFRAGNSIRRKGVIYVINKITHAMTTIDSSFFFFLNKRTLDTKGQMCGMDDLLDIIELKVHNVIWR